MNTAATDDIGATIEHLEALELKLRAIDEEDLDDADKNKLAEDLNECSANLMALRNATLASLTVEFRAKEGALRTAAAALEGAVGQIEKAVEVINTVAAGLKPISRIVSLLG
jgi:hypothetical protein